MLHVTKDNYQKEIVEFAGVVVLDFWATWCGPCAMFTPVFESLAEVNPEVRFGKIDVDAEPKLAEEYGIMSIPCIVFLKNGKEVKRIVGYHSEEQVQFILDSIV